MEFQLGTLSTALCIEPEAFDGVRRIASAVAGDIEAVTGSRPEMSSTLKAGCQNILCATLGRSPIAERLISSGLLNRNALEGKREVFQICYASIDGLETLVICGSDKRGTIYGMFTLSEYIGVSPLVYWGDAAPAKRSCVTIGRDIEMISKEPSVRYRGFFINDEWPCFGSWSHSHFGDVNADCYEKVFEFLLRMKGNYLWPAMWVSSFPLDGPGSANEELADLYGVIMGYSHHEPCLRASEEWDKVRGEGTKYGSEWNFYTNEPGLLNYWEDALKRSGGYENIITIGMRGERDTSMLGENSTLAENIDLLKRIITKQRELITKHVPRKATQLLALYKEVERYFYGDAETEGLQSWSELDDVLFLLCEDNHNHLRTVPPKNLRNHPGGWGMYYHFDYHGGPISYEWVDSTPLSVCWEQMTQAWEFGIRDLWIVNVGDLKLHEVPLTYFMALAYDYDKWGSGNRSSGREYMAQWAQKTFPEAGEYLQGEIAGVFTDYIRLNSMRRPEAMNSGIYHPCHYRETDRMIAMAQAVLQRSQAVYDALTGEQKDAYYSMIHYSATASAVLALMHLYAAKNRHYADQGKTAANRYAALAEQCITQDLALAQEFAAFNNGKWNGMQLAPHIGFTKWNEDDCRYPALCKVTPLPKPMMKVNRIDRAEIAAKNYGTPICINVPDFRYAGITEVQLEIANGGSVPFEYTVTAVGGELPAWLKVTPARGKVSEQETVTLLCDRSLLPDELAECTLHISDGDAAVAVSVSGCAVHNDSNMTFTEQNGILVIPADRFSSRHNTADAAFECIPDYGKYGTGMKVFPSTAAFGAEDEKPGLTYSFCIPESGDYLVELLTAPNNPIEIGLSVNILLETAEARTVLALVPADFRAGENSDERWSSGVLDQIHIARTALHFEAGVQTLTIGAMDPGVVLEQIRISSESPLPGYLGPEPTACSSEY